MRKFKSYLICTIIAVTLGMCIRTFVFSSATVSAKTLSNYKSNTHLLVNHLSKSYTVGDNIIFKYKGENYIRTVKSIQDKSVIVIDRNNQTQNINKSDVIGKVIYKY